MGNKCLENVAKFKYLGMTPTNENCTREENKSRLNSGNGHCHLVWNLSPSCLLFKNINMKIYRIIILPVLSSRCETWFLKISKGLIYAEGVQEQGAE
jgi:hypothetical protein